MAARVVKTIKNGALAIDIRKYADGRFGFDWQAGPSDRRKVRLHSLGDAHARATEFLTTARCGKIDLLSIDEELFAEFLRWRAERRTPALIPALVDAFLDTKRGKGRSGKTMRDLEGTLSSFANEFDGPIGALRRAEVESWLDGRNVGPRRWNNMLSHIISLIRFGRREGAIGADLHPVELIDKHKTVGARETYSSDEFRRMLKVCRPRELVYMIGGGLCGMRPEELRPDIRSDKPALQWENFLWEKRKIDMPAAVAKDGRRRFVPLCDAALEFFSPWRNSTGECIARCDVSKITGWIARKSGVKWLPDGLRHSYASYRLAITQNIAALADEMGNSVKIIKDHYLDRKHEDDAEKWFSIRPRDIFPEWPLGTEWNFPASK